jgi:predicted HicB family RNase H-like nuclease
MSVIKLPKDGPSKMRGRPRKYKDWVYVNTRMPRALHDAISKEADENYTSVNSIIVKHMMRSFEL